MRNDLDLAWPREGLRRVPYEIYLPRRRLCEERRRIFQGPVWNYLCLEIGAAESRRLPRDVRRRRAGHRRPRPRRQRSTPSRIAAPIAARCCASSRRQRRKRSAASITIGPTTSRGNLTGVAFQRGVNRKGGMPPDFDRGAARAARSASRRSPAWCSAPSPTTAPPTRDLSRAGDRGAHPPRAWRSRSGCWAATANILPSNWKIYADNLQRLLSRQPAAHLLHHLQAEPAVAAGRHHRHDSGGNHVSYSKRATDRPSADYDADRRCAPSARISASRTRRCSAAATSSATASPCKSSPCSPPSSCSRSRTASPCARSCRGASARPSCTGPISAMRTTTTAMLMIRQKQIEPGRARRLYLDGGRRGRRASSSARCPAARRRLDRPDGRRRTSSQDTRATERAVRGFWRAYRRHMGI